ncbi:division inhibitor protein [Nocardia otitidiscaviarum]|uniref:Division inhibitor protein n=2 Tax=Nocardia otitidiscaviarum TaxID=1823 RepID=A0A379JKB0_9NOCA|nr:division inhibitor protein [Nocardia otitidiscaviarum]
MGAMADSATTPRRRGRPVRVSRADIIAATTRLLAAGGKDAFSMRKLADELGVSTAAVYHHFPAQAQLFIAVLSARAEELPAPRLPQDPRERLVALIAYLIDILQELPWVAELLVGGESFGRAALWILDEFIRSARALGASPQYAAYMYSALWRFVLGELLMRRADAERVAAPADARPPRWTEFVTPEDLAEFPEVRDILPQWSAVRELLPGDTAIRRFVDGLLSGIDTLESGAQGTDRH